MSHSPPEGILHNRNLASSQAARHMQKQSKTYMAKLVILPTTILQESNGSNAKSMTLEVFCKVGTELLSRRPVLLSYSNNKNQ